MVRRLSNLKSAALMCSAFLFGTVQPRELVDKICARVDDAIITHSQLQTPQITKNYGLCSVDEAISEELWLKRAQQNKVTPNELDIDKQVIALKQDKDVLDVDDASANEVLRKEYGIDFPTYRAQLNRIHMTEIMKNHELRSRSGVSRHEITTYYDQHPEKIPARYRLSLATLTPDQATQWQTLRAKPSAISWENLEWMKLQEISKPLRCVRGMRRGEVSDAISLRGGNVAVRVDDLVEGRTKTLEECYSDIEKHLHYQKMDRFAEEMGKDLRSSAVIEVM